jgi:hypothetical protein
MVFHGSESLIEKAEEASVSEPLCVAVEIVRAHLVHGDAHDQPGSLSLGVDGLGLLCGQDRRT